MQPRSPKKKGESKTKYEEQNLGGKIGVQNYLDDFGQQVNQISLIIDPHYLQCIEDNAMQTMPLLHPYSIIAEQSREV